MSELTKTPKRLADFINRGVTCPVHGRVYTVYHVTPKPWEGGISRYVCADCEDAKQQIEATA